MMINRARKMGQAVPMFGAPIMTPTMPVMPMPMIQTPTMPVVMPGMPMV